MFNLASFVVLATLFTTPALAFINTDTPVMGYVAFTMDGNKTSVPNAANGLYTSHNDTHLAFYGPVDSDSDVPDTVNNRDLVTRQLTCNVVCNGQTTYHNDVAAANRGMAGVLAYSPNFRGSISYVFNNVWAFGCDYGNGQYEPVSQWYFDVGCVTFQCTTSGGGWNVHNYWRSSYGRQVGGFSCH